MRFLWPLSLLPSAAAVPGHRAMFPAAAAWAGVSMLWVLAAGGDAPPWSALGHGWHAHEMVFGLGGAAVAGYLLGASPGWSGRPPLTGWPVAVLLALWLLARLAAAGVIPLALTPAPSLWLTLLLARDADSAKGRAILLIPLALTAAAIAVAAGAIAPGSLIAPFVLLITVLGAPMLRAFTDNRLGLARPQAPALPRLPGPGTVAIAGQLAALALSAFPTAAAVALATAATATASRQALWLRREVLGDGLLAMLHLAFLWLPVALVLAALDRLGVGTCPLAALHAAGAGLMATTIIAIAARASARRSDGHLCANRADLAGFALVWLAALLRVTLPGLWPTAAGLWVLGWGLVLLSHLRALARPVERPVFSGRRARHAGAGQATPRSLGPEQATPTEGTPR